MLVSIIIPNLNSPIISKTLESIKTQNYKGDFDVFVIGQDHHRRVVQSNQVRFIYTPMPVSPAKARNIGIELSSGEIIVFIDSDCIADSEWLEKLIQHYESPEVSVVGGAVTFPEANYWTLCDNIATFYQFLSTSPGGFRDQLPSLNLSVRRDAINAVGNFDERYLYPAGEDADFTTRLRIGGYNLYFDPTAKVIHLPGRSSLLSVLKHAFNFGRFSVKVDKRYQVILHHSFFLSNWLLAIFSSPFLAGGVLIKMLTNRFILKRIYTLPVVYLAKLFWCLGAAHTLRKGSAFRE